MASYKRIVLTEHDSTATTDSDVKRQLNKFDTTYTNKKLNELYNEFDSMTINSETVNSTIVKENAVDNAKPYATFKTAVYLTTAVIVTALLAFLVIYNIFVINGLNNNIQLLQGDVKVAQEQYETVKQSFGNLSEEELQELINTTFNGEYGSVENNLVANVAMLETHDVGDEVVSTNWFDKFCTFFSNLFGG